VARRQLDVVLIVCELCGGQPADIVTVRVQVVMMGRMRCMRLLFGFDCSVVVVVLGR
jgi:hypothetical protein